MNNMSETRLTGSTSGYVRDVPSQQFSRWASYESTHEDGPNKLISSQVSSSAQQVLRTQAQSSVATSGEYFSFKNPTVSRTLPPLPGMMNTLLNSNTSSGVQLSTPGRASSEVFVGSQGSLQEEQGLQSTVPADWTDGLPVYKEYVGETFCDLPHGQGEMTFSSGEVYVGEFRRGLVHGKGKYTYSDGAVFDGKFQNGLRHGRGTYTYSNGTVYVGEFYNGLKHGDGTTTIPNGDVYDGEFYNGLKHGTGKWEDSNGDVYDGKFHKDLPHGQGKITFSSGKIHVGAFQRGLAHGKGELTSANGAVCEQAWENGRPIKA